MPRGQTTIDVPFTRQAAEDEGDVLQLALAIVWAPEEPERLGEVLLPEDGDVFGRGPPEDGDGERRVELVRQRPGRNVRAASPENPFLSRRHLRFSVGADAIELEVLGRRPLLVGSSEVRSASIREGDLVEIAGIYAFYCVRRPRTLPEGGRELAPDTFGTADRVGVVGESAAAYRLRSEIAFAGKREAHVLVTGASGTGKELVAQAIHELSSRAKKEIVSRNAATFPSGLIDAELFGNIQNYPNMGMPERLGLIGQADRSTLFLDEIGELPTELQAHLLRVLDGGEYQRLGDARRRVADIRLIGATNRSIDELKEDVAARLGLRIHVPGLDERREDVPLLVRHLLVRWGQSDKALTDRFFARPLAPRVSSALVHGLVRHDYTTHVRELSAILLRAIASSRGGELDLTKEVKAMLRSGLRSSGARELGSDEIRQALARHDGVKEKVWRELGLPSRHALHRLMKKLNIPDR